jgi:hypothetical protein
MYLPFAVDSLSPMLLHCRCFPKFPPQFTGSVYSMLNTSAGVLSSAAGTVQDAWSSGGPTFSNYVADISKGILIIIIGGLGCGMGLSLVSGGVAQTHRDKIVLH